MAVDLTNNILFNSLSKNALRRSFVLYFVSENTNKKMIYVNKY